ncbi:toxin glutamine deamidase domain-containing protein [Mycobacterium camsae]|uniref:toxin glutamine deamidase domain-containing protein n=1 Tax=Mycobacterium gordonae TaxID=1778 RepID=UPI001980815C|nr:toxin glutamine deamidase domain-containing protein [Mycobacterium gordonae]
MGIEIPGWLRWVGDLIGEPFPEGDETACRRQADRWRHYATQLDAHKDGLAAATQTTLAGFAAGDVHNTLDQLLKPYGNSIDQIADQLRQLADAVDNVATEIEFAKEMFIANLVALAATLVALAASAWINWGAPVEAAAAIAGIELVISQAIRAAAAKVATEALSRVIAQLVTRALGSAAVNAGISAGLNAGIQGQQMVQGNRHDFDWESWRNDVASGAISGAVMGPVLKGAHDFDAGSALGNRARNFGASFVGNAGGAAAAQQALTGHVNLADALGAGAVFGAVDGARIPGVHSAGPELTALTGERPGTPVVEPLPATQHQQTPLESSATGADHSGQGGGVRLGDVDVPLNLGPPHHDPVPLSHNGFSDAAATASPSTVAPGGHAASVPPSSPAAHAAGHADPSAGGPLVPAARAGVSDVAPAARGHDAAGLREVADAPVRGAEAPAGASVAAPSHELARATTSLREVPASRDTPQPRDLPPPHDAQPAREAQPGREALPRRDAAPLGDGQAPRDARSSTPPQRSREAAADPGERPRSSVPESRHAREAQADNVRRAKSAAGSRKDEAGQLHNQLEPVPPQPGDVTLAAVPSPVLPDGSQPRPTAADTVRAPNHRSGPQDPATDPPPGRPDPDTGHDDLPPPGPGPFDPTGFDNPADHRNFGPHELAPLEDPMHQAVLERALRDPSGGYESGADPRTNAYGGLVNDGGPTVDGRANNCVDSSLAALASFYGEPTVSVPRFLDQLPDGTIDLTSGEASGLARARAWFGDDLHLSDQNLSVRQQFADLHQQIAQLGPGASALVVNDWQARDAAGNLMYHPDGAPVLDGAHATVIVYPHGASGPVWWDPQHSLTSDHPPAMLVNESAYLWSTPIAAGHFGPTPHQGGRDGAARDRGTSTGIPGSDLPRPHLSGDPVRNGLGRFADPDGGRRREPGGGPGEAGDRLGDRDRDHALEPADQRGGRDLHDGQAIRPAGGKSDLPTPVEDHPAAHPGRLRDHRLPDDCGIAEAAARTHAGAPADHQQADLHARAEGRTVQGGYVPRRMDESAEPGSLARRSDGGALADDGVTPEYGDSQADSRRDSVFDHSDPGDRGRAVASHPDPDHSRGVANDSLWKRIPPVSPDELRHHLADKLFGEQRARDNATWWRQLSGEQQRALIDSYPREIGNAEGIPAWARSEANQHELSRLRDELRSRADAGERLSRREAKELRRYDGLRAALKDARVKAARLGGDVHVLAFDPRAFGGDGRMVVSVGHDPSHADAVSWHVPGYTTTIDKIGLNLDNALNHLESVLRQDPAARVASIAWIGYDSPQGMFKGVWDVMHTKLASTGGEILHGDLAAFNAGRDAFAGDGSAFCSNDVFGHSYGSTTTSFAARGGGLTTHVRSVTLLGSPGAGPLRHASEFGVGDQVFVASSSRDFVTTFGGRTFHPGGGWLFGRLGMDPAMQAFGATRVTAEFPHYLDLLGADGTTATHTAYYWFDPRLPETPTESLANFGRIGAGGFDRVHIEGNRFEGSGLRPTEPALSRPLENHPDDPAQLRRRMWDPPWHSEGGDHRVPQPEGDGGTTDDRRCAHGVNEFLAHRYGRDVPALGEPGPSGVPARKLFQTWGAESRFASYAEVHDTLLRHGDGASAVLASQWAAGPRQGGHAYVAVNEGGTVHLYERVGDRYEPLGWPPLWGERAVQATAVGYLDRKGNALDPLDGRPGQLEAADAVGDVAGELPHGSPLTDEQRDAILSIPKGERPDPAQYLPAEFIEQHLARFDDGASRYMVLDNLNAFGIGQRDGTTFVFPSSELDSLTATTENDLRLLEQALGLPANYFDAYEIVRVDISEPATYGLRMPSGNEAGANNQWLPGGFLPKGMPEAVIDGGAVSPDDYTVTRVSGRAERRE